MTFSLQLLGNKKSYNCYENRDSREGSAVHIEPEENLFDGWHICNSPCDLIKEALSALSLGDLRVRVNGDEDLAWRLLLNALWLRVWCCGLL